VSTVIIGCEADFWSRRPISKEERVRVIRRLKEFFGFAWRFLLFSRASAAECRRACEDCPGCQTGDEKCELVLLRRRFEAVRSIGLFLTNERVFAMATTMKVVPYIGFIVLVMVFGSAIVGTLIRRKLPESHLSDETQSVVRLVMGVVGTLTALVLGLLVATASARSIPGIRRSPSYPLR
jgi:hypothetical protein